MRRVQVFDVNETLLDLAAMDPHFQQIFGDAAVRRSWFTQMIQSALVATVTGANRQFGAHAMAALEMTAEQTGVVRRRASTWTPPPFPASSGWPALPPTALAQQPEPATSTRVSVGSRAEPQRVGAGVAAAGPDG
jgi:hypothetical protein